MWWWKWWLSEEREKEEKQKREAGADEARWSAGVLLSWKSQWSGALWRAFTGGGEIWCWGFGGWTEPGSGFRMGIAVGAPGSFFRFAVDA